MASEDDNAWSRSEVPVKLTLAKGKELESKTRKEERKQYREK